VSGRSITSRSVPQFRQQIPYHARPVVGDLRASSPMRAPRSPVLPCRCGVRQPLPGSRNFAGKICFAVSACWRHSH